MANKLTATLFIKDYRTGNNINLNKFYTQIIGTKGASNGILDHIMRGLPGANPKDISTGKTITVLRTIKETFSYNNDLSVDSAASTKFQPAAKKMNIQTLGSYSAEISYNTKIVDIFDEQLLVPFISKSVAEYFESLKVLHRKKAINLLKNDAANYQLYNNADLKTRIAQPSAATTYAIGNVLSDINKGIRIPVALTKSTWDAGDNRVAAIRKAIDYLLNISTPNSTEVGYPFAYDGYSRDNIVILTKPGNQYNLTANNVSQIINAGDGINQMIPSIDGVKIYEEKLLDSDIEYVVMLKNTLFLEQNKIAGATELGTLERGTSAKVVNEDGTTTVENLTSNQLILRINFNSYMGVFTPGGTFILKNKA